MLTKKFIGFATLFLLIFTAGMVHTVQDANAIRVSLKRVVFEGSKRSEILTIINNTAEERTYRLGYKRYRMDENKSLIPMDEEDGDAGVLWAEDMIRFAPRRVTIPPGQAQQVRLLFRRPADLKDAEYRAHLWIVTEAKPAKFDATPSGKKQSIKLAVQPAISLPVFVRAGNLQVSASITDAKLAKSEKGLEVKFTLHREGNRSIYGDFDFTCTAGGKNVILHQVRGISVYPEINKRNLSFDIPLKEETSSTCSQVSIQYRSDPDDTMFKGAVLAEGSASF